MAQQQIGLIGLAVMGENLVLNLERNGFSVAVFNRTTEKVDEFIKGRAAGKNIVGTHSLEELVACLERPRKILLMVKAGQPVQAVIDQLKPLLEPGDILIDGGNSWYEDTEARTRELEAMGLRYVGMGVSGGEEGALHGPSLMPGGMKEAYAELAPLLTKIAAQVDDGPCVTYVGPGGSGHYVKMVHNGIEYGDMQLIAEAYDLLKNVLGLSAAELHQVFSEWNQTEELNSFLIEITAHIFAVMDPETGQPLVDMILDKAGQKGTGRWTVTSALELGVPIPTIAANALDVIQRVKRRLYVDHPANIRFVDPHPQSTGRDQKRHTPTQPQLFQLPPLGRRQPRMVGVRGNALLAQPCRPSLRIPTGGHIDQTCFSLVGFDRVVNPLLPLMRGNDRMYRNADVGTVRATAHHLWVFQTQHPLDGFLRQGVGSGGKRSDGNPCACPFGLLQGSPHRSQPFVGRAKAVSPLHQTVRLIENNAANVHLRAG